MNSQSPLPTTLSEQQSDLPGASALQAAVALSRLAVWQLDPVQDVVTCNEACAGMLQVPSGQPLNLEAFLHRLPASARKALITAFHAFRTGDEKQAQTTAGGYLFAFTRVADETQNRTLICGTVTGMRAEQLPYPFQTFSFKGNDVGLFRIFLEDDSIDYTPALARNITGRSDVRLTRQEFISYIHPEDAAARQAAYEQAARTGDLFYEGRTIWQDGSVHWIRTIGSYSYDAAGKPFFFTGTVQDITAQKIREAELRETEQRFRSMIHQAPMGIALLSGRDMTVEVGNEKIFELWGKSPARVGETILELLPEIKEQGFLELLKSVYDTGVPYFGAATQVLLIRNGVPETCFFDFTYTPLRDASGAVSGVMVLANEVTAQVLARKKVEESEKRFIALIEEAPFATAVYKGRNLIIDIANDAMIRLWGKDCSVIGQQLALALPELEGQPFLHLLDRVFTSGESHHEKEARADLVVDGVLSTFYFNYTYKPLRDERGQIYAILNMAVDVTAQVLARRRLEESELFAHSIIYNSPVAKVVLSGVDLRISMINENLLQIFGRDKTILNQSLEVGIPELWQSQHRRFMQVMQTGETFAENEQEYRITRNGTTEKHCFNVIFKALPSADGGYHGVIVTLVDVTEQVRNRQRIAEAKEALKGAIELAELGTWEMDIARDEFHYSDRLCEWVGLPADQPVPRAKILDPVHPDDRERITRALLEAISAGSGKGFNEEYRLVHPRTGVVRTVHAQGVTYFDSGHKPVRMTGTVRDVTHEREVQAALELEVKKRTAELNLLNKQLTDAVSELAAANEQLRRSNDDLAQYAHVASHDLQEPLRKIRMFSGMLKDNPEAKTVNCALIAKINQSAERMSLLIKDLLDYSRLLKTEDLKKPVDLNEVINQILVDFELRIQEKNAAISVAPLPVIEAVPLQMSQLFFNLIGNALKFSLQDRPPVIQLTVSEMSEQETLGYFPYAPYGATYYHIAISDNGIGFEEKYAQHIFEVFKRLHGRDVYPGSGIGLALCRRIVDNHQGHIFAASVPGEGTTFHVMLPKQQV